ncbi:hypothetical protein ABT297_21185 [Dactylosporangium sp. NPDC000555]|uniref:hypothetical protein n=1 Tax=Dactylosporangium sp. NPDC000555 TaxID=3154260 RepID=UPI00332E4B43
MARHPMSAAADADEALLAELRRVAALADPMPPCRCRRAAPPPRRPDTPGGTTRPAAPTPRRSPPGA